MSNGITINISELRDAFRRKREFTKRSIPLMLNTAAFYIARGAVRSTVKVAASKIRTELDELLKPENYSSLGKFFEREHPEIARNYSQSRTVNVNGKEVPLVALLINSKLGKSGQKGLQGQKMATAADNFKSNRVKSGAFIAAGFLPAVKLFEPLAEKKGQAPPRDITVQDRHGIRQLGRATAAGQELVAFAEIVNTASSLDDGGKGLEIFGTRGLQIAINNEVREIDKYINKKMQEQEDNFK